MMTGMEKDIEDVCVEHSIRYKILNGAIVKRYMCILKNKFAFDEHSSIQIMNCLSFAGGGDYSFIGKIINAENVYFFLRNDDRSIIFDLIGFDVPKIIGEMYGFEYFISNKNTDYLMAENFHDVFMFVGEHEKLKSYFLKMKNLQQ